MGRRTGHRRLKGVMEIGGVDRETERARQTETERETEINGARGIDRQTNRETKRKR